MIRPSYRPFYGREWRAYRRAMIARRGSRCTRCGLDCAKYLNFAHTHHDPLNSDVVRVCAACHARMDSAHRVAIARRRRARAAGQLWLSAELEWAAAPAWEIPREVFEAAQGSLF